MPTDIGRDDVRRFLARKVQLIEVLPEEEYAQEHLKAAINVPLTTLTLKSTTHFDRKIPVIVYCHDGQ